MSHVLIKIIGTLVSFSALIFNLRFGFVMLPNKLLCIGQKFILSTVEAKNGLYKFRTSMSICRHISKLLDI